MKHILPIILMLVLPYMAAQAQKVEFQSDGFQYAVRTHLGLDESEDIDQSLTDTITSLNLSGLSISDLRDVCYLPALRSLDLSVNSITDISDLMQLEYLEELDLTSNDLQYIDALAFMKSDSLHVSLALNHIFNIDPEMLQGDCQLTIDGLDYQTALNSPKLDICVFETGVDLSNNLSNIRFRAFSNEATEAELTYGGNTVTVPVDGTYTTLTTDSPVAEIIPVICRCGTQSDTTYIIPYKTVEVRQSSPRHYAIVLPSSFNLNDYWAELGEVEADDNNSKGIVYQPTEEVDSIGSDIVYFSFSKGWNSRGHSYLNIVKSDTKIGDANKNGIVNNEDIQTISSHVLGGNPTTFSTLGADVNNDGVIDITDIVKLIELLKQ